MKEPIISVENVGRIERNGDKRRIQLLIYTLLQDDESLGFLVRELLTAASKRTFEIECMDEVERSSAAKVLFTKADGKLRIVPHES